MFPSRLFCSLLGMTVPRDPYLEGRKKSVPLILNNGGERCIKKKDYHCSKGRVCLSSARVTQFLHEMNFHENLATKIALDRCN